MSKKKEKPTSVDALLDEIRENTSADHEESIKTYEKFISDKESKRRVNKIINPAFDGTSKGGGAYNHSVDKIDEIAEEINNNSKNKEEELDEVVIEKEEDIHKIMNTYMSEALSKLHPKMMDNIKEDLEKMNDKDKYERLSSLFDSLLVYHKEADKIGLSGIAKGLKKNKSTASEIKDLLGGFKEKHKEAIDSYMINKAHSNYINSLPLGVYAHHLIKRLEKEGYEFKTPTQKLLFLNNQEAHQKVHLELSNKEKMNKKERLYNIDGLVEKENYHRKKAA